MSVTRAPIDLPSSCCVAPDASRDSLPSWIGKFPSADLIRAAMGECWSALEELPMGVGIGQLHSAGTKAHALAVRRLRASLLKLNSHKLKGTSEL